MARPVPPSRSSGTALASITGLWRRRPGTLDESDCHCSNRRRASSIFWAWQPRVPAVARGEDGGVERGEGSPDRVGFLFFERLNSLFSVRKNKGSARDALRRTWRVRAQNVTDTPIQLLGPYV
jgi:hypothetical protein